MSEQAAAQLCAKETGDLWHRYPCGKAAVGVGPLSGDPVCRRHMAGERLTINTDEKRYRARLAREAARKRQDALAAAERAVVDSAITWFKGDAPTLTLDAAVRALLALRAQSEKSTDSQPTERRKR